MHASARLAREESACLDDRPSAASRGPRTVRKTRRWRTAWFRPPAARTRVAALRGGSSRAPRRTFRVVEPSGAAGCRSMRLTIANCSGGRTTDTRDHRKHRPGSNAYRAYGTGLPLLSTYLAFARKVGFVPPSRPVVTGALGMPLLISSAVSVSSRRCFSRTEVAMSSGAP
jgi:hypothetical protein